MASRKGPKSRKARRDPGMRAWRSTPRTFKKALRKGGKLSQAQKSAIGTTVRKARIARGKNPNSGLAAHQHIRSKTRGTSSKAHVRKVAAKVSARAAASGKYAAPMTQRTANRKARRIIRARR